MSKLLSISNNNNKLYKTFNTMTPPRRGKEEKSLSDNSIEVNDPSNSDKNKNQNQKAILSTLLKTLLDKSLKKLESDTKKHTETLKWASKTILDLNKNIKYFISGVEKKIKEEEEKKLNLSRRARMSKTQYRSKTYMNLRTPRHDLSTRNFSQMKNRKNEDKKKVSKRISNNLNFKTDINLEKSSHNFPKTPFASKTSSNFNIKSKNSKDVMNYYKKIEKTGYRNTKKNMNTIILTREEEEMCNDISNKYNTINNTSENSKSKKRKSIKNIEKCIEKKQSIKNTDKGLEKRKSIKNNEKIMEKRKSKIFEKKLEKRKSIKNNEKGLIRRKSIKKIERGVERRKSLKSFKTEGRNLKRKASIKKKNKIEGNSTIENVINNNLTDIKSQAPMLSELEKNISNFNFNDINIINNNINILNNNILNFEETDDIDLKNSENININQIINNNNKNEVKNKEETPHIKSVLKELEENNEKKPKVEEEKEKKKKKEENEEKEKIENIVRKRSCSKNRDRKTLDSISLDEDIAGSLNDVKLMIEGVSGVLNKINDKNRKYEKRIIKTSPINEDVNKEEKNTENKNTNANSNTIDTKNDEKEKDDKYNLLSEIDREIMELIEAEEKRQKEREREKSIKKINENNNDNNNLENKNKTEKISNEKNNREKASSSRHKISYNRSERNRNKKRNERDYDNSPLIRNLRFEKEKQIINEDVMNTIKTEDNILTKDLSDINLNLEKQNSKESNNNNNEDNMANIISKVTNIIQEIEHKNSKGEINKMNESERKERKRKKPEKSNYLNNIEKQLIESNKLNNEEEQYDAIMNESRIMRDEQLVDFNNQSLNYSSFINNQNSIISHTRVLSDQYLLVPRDHTSFFSMENIKNYGKDIYIGILDFLDFQEQIEFTGVHRGFTQERITLLNKQKRDLLLSLELPNKEAIDDLIVKIRLRYSKEELSKPLNDFQIARGSVKAVELLNNELYGKLFNKIHIEKNEEEICNIYRILFVLINEFTIANTINNDLFWKKCSNYLTDNSNGKIGTFILLKFKNLSFERKKLFLINKYLIGMKKSFTASYYSKICGTTGLLIFMIKDVLEYWGILMNEKKTQPARMLDTLLYYRNTIDKLNLFIEYLSGIQSVKRRDKKAYK